MLGLQGGDSHALLVDGLAQPELTRCKIVGIIHSTDMGWDGIKHHENTGENDEVLCH